MCPTKVSNQEPLVSTSDGSIATTTAPRILYRKPYLLPMIVFLAIPLVSITTYFIADLNGHVAPGFPFISETGSLPPESCIFSQVLNVVSFLLLLTVYIKYQQVREFAKLRPSRAKGLRFNGVAAGFGAASCVGLSIVANFQEHYLLSVHTVGAFAWFQCGTVYFCMQTMYSRQMSPEINSMMTVYVRGVLSALCIIFNLITGIATGIAMLQFEGEVFSGPSRKNWGPDDGGYTARLAATISEWLLALSYCSFILSCVKELKDVHVYSPEIVLINVEPETEKFDVNINTISKLV